MLLRRACKSCHNLNHLSSDGYASFRIVVAARTQGTTSTVSLATVPIVGRPNVGKSTLFNRLLAQGTWRRQQRAIVSPLAGTTRDRREGRARLAGTDFAVVDTGGLDDPRAGVLNAAISDQVSRALGESRVAIFVIDAREGVTPLDRQYALWDSIRTNIDELL